MTDENNEAIEVDLGYGKAKFRRADIEKIERSEPAEAEVLKVKWQKKKVEDKYRDLSPESQSRKLNINPYSGHIVVDAMLNGRVKASFILDTGASTMLLSRAVAGKLGIAINSSSRIILCQVADGRRVKGALTYLQSVKVGDMEAKDVEAVVLLEEAGGMGLGDGLLGMSFLNRFKFQVDYRKNILLLEKSR